ncbi:hypothetical protein GQ53DRAFT_834646 [Thozetella sp. PMI_491]|nr:hypothetical protein GQ53DRAFT_834646 [Thozetella sp. PMI_491]
MSSVDSHEQSSQSVPGSLEDDSGSMSDFSLPYKPETPASYSSRRLACPYYKRDSAKYFSSRTCKGPGWTSIARLKEHLYRTHLQSKYPCPRCYEPFERISDRDDHMRRDPPCKKGEANKAPEGFNKWQEKELRSRKSAYASGSEADRWHYVYRILFPDDDVRQYPSPYYEDQPPQSPAEAPGDELEQFIRMVRSEPTLRRLHAQILQVLQRQGQNQEQAGLASELTRLFVTSQMEILGRFRGRLGDVNPLEQGMGLGLAPWPEPQSERRSSTSTTTYKGHNRGVDGGQGPNLAPALSNPASESLGMMHSDVDINRMLFPSTPGLWHEGHPVPGLPYPESMGMHIGAQFDVAYPPDQMGDFLSVGELDPTGQLDVSPQSFPLEMPPFMYDMQRSIGDCDEQYESHHPSPSMDMQPLHERYSSADEP